jgi:superfamily II DNA or RNA helicase
VRPLGGAEGESTGIYTPIEPVEHARFDLPDPSHVGDHRSCRLLREAVRISSRAGAGPFRSFARIAIEPRPYQLVPLLMALRQPTVRLLIADDVGVGKTVEAALVARELLDRGEAKRLAVLCPPHLAEQWAEELQTKFHIDAELVLTSTAGRLERSCAIGQSLFEVYPYVVVSLDFIKAERRRAEFLRACPDLVIVDEAHACSYGFQGRGRHQRFDLVSGLAADESRHLILVTATPHTGNEEAFRSLLTFLDPRFAELPPDLSGRENEVLRRRLASHIVQRRRADLRRYLAEETSFPDADEAEDSYALTPAYKAFLQKVLAYVAETAEAPGLEGRQQRVRWWSALALLRCVASSPAAAAATLRSRAPGTEAETAADVDAIGARTVFDVGSDDQVEGVDVAPGADPEPDAGGEGASPEARRIREHLLRLAREAEGLAGRRDAKLGRAVELLRSLVDDSYAPIVFCRFIPTAEYVAEALRTALGNRAEVACVTGRLPSEEREARVEALKGAPRRVLVCTDCLSEGINLQDGFDAVFHYDLAWSPTRHEQRQGRVNRFGQRRPLVRAITYYGRDNGVDGIVLDALIRKHQRIRNRLGISVPVPLDSNAVFHAIVQGLVLRGREAADQQMLSFMTGPVQEATEQVDLEWERASERERRSRTLFAQETIRVDEVAQELEAARR